MMRLVLATSPCDLLQGLVAGTSPIVCAHLNTSEKQAKYEQEEQKPPFQPSWQLKRP